MKAETKIPKVSVIIPTYNRAKYLKEAIESVLSQTYKDFEVIIVDDGSTDNTREIIEEFLKPQMRNGNIRYFYQDNKGVSNARNKGMREAKGEYIAFLDSDDKWLPDKLKVYIEYFENYPDVSLIGGQMMVIDEYGRVKEGRLKPTIFPASDLKGLLHKGSSLASSLMVKRKVIEEGIFFEEGFEGLEDLYFCIKTSSKYKISNLSSPLAFYREHSCNSSSSKIRISQTRIRVYERLIKEYPHLVEKDLYNRKLSKNYYLLGRYHFNEKDYLNAYKHMLQAIKINPLLGKEFIAQEKTPGIFNIIKPYFACCYCWLLLTITKIL